MHVLIYNLHVHVYIGMFYWLHHTRILQGCMHLSCLCMPDFLLSLSARPALWGGSEPLPRSGLWVRDLWAHPPPDLPLYLCPGVHRSPLSPECNKRRSVCPSVCLSILLNFISYRKLHNFLFMPNTCTWTCKNRTFVFHIYCHPLDNFCQSLTVTGPTTPDPCQSQPCQHGGTCRPLAADQFACECGQGRDGLVYRGDNCEMEGNYCDTSPCVSGHCVPTEHSYR